MEFKQYRRTQIAEMADWAPGVDMTGVSISSVDLVNGSPKLGDKIARNPVNHADRWLVAKEYFETNFEEILIEPMETPFPNGARFAINATVQPVSRGEVER